MGGGKQRVATAVAGRWRASYPQPVEKVVEKKISEICLKMVEVSNKCGILVLVGNGSTTTEATQCITATQRMSVSHTN